MHVPEQMSDVVILANATHKTRRSIKHRLETLQQVTRYTGQDGMAIVKSRHNE